MVVRSGLYLIVINGHSGTLQLGAISNILSNDNLKLSSDINIEIVVPFCNLYIYTKRGIYH